MHNIGRISLQGSIQCVLHAALSYVYCEHWIARVCSSPRETGWQITDEAGMGEIGRHIYTLIA